MTAYDPARHRGLQRLLAAQDTGAEQAAETQTPRWEMTSTMKG
jgi:hypothetical protein